MDKNWEFNDFPKERIVEDVQTVLGVNKKIAEKKVANGKITPSSQESTLYFFVPGYKYPIYDLKSSQVSNTINNFVWKFLGDRNELYRIFTRKGYKDEKLRAIVNYHMRAIWGKPELIYNAINEIHYHLNIAEISLTEKAGYRQIVYNRDGEKRLQPQKSIGTKIRDETLNEFWELYRNCSLRMGRGIRGEWGSLRLLLNSAHRIKFTDYLKLRNSFDLQDWENMLKFETGFAKKHQEIQPVNFLKKDKYFARIFQFDTLKDALGGDYNEILAERIVVTAVWWAKEIFTRTPIKGNWRGAIILYISCSTHCGVLDVFPINNEFNKGFGIDGNAFRKEFNIPSTTFYNYRKVIGEASEYLPIETPTFYEFLSKPIF